MRLNLIASARSGSTYFQFFLRHILYAKYKDIKNYGEIFAPWKKDYVDMSFDDRLRLHTHSAQPGIYKIFPIHFIEYENNVNENWLNYIDSLYSSPDTYNIFLYRENILDQLLSYMLVTVNWGSHIKDPSLTDKTEKQDISDRHLTNICKNYIEVLQRSIEVYNRYNFDTVVKYEDFTGNPEVDFSSFIASDKLDKIITRSNYTRKMNTFEHKKKIMPYEKIKEVFYGLAEEQGLDLNLPFESKGLSSLEFLKGI